MIYLDNSATTQPFDSVIKAIADNMAGNFGNASSLHSMGINAEKVIKDAKQTILSALKRDGDIIFTSGATESSNTVLFGVPKTYKHNGKRIVTTSFEHPSVENPLRELENEGYEVVRVKPPKSGEPQDFEQRIIDAADENTVFVANHFSHNGYTTYEDMQRITPGFIISYDGLTLDASQGKKGA